MKKHTVFAASAMVVLAVILALVLGACVTTGGHQTQAVGTAVPASSGSMTLDEAIALAAERMEARLPRDTEVALINVSSPTAAFSEYVLTGLEAVLVNNGKLVVVDRANLDKIRAEQGFQASGEVSDESAKSIGQMLGAGAIVTGTLTNIGSSYRLTLKAINVEKATVAASSPATIANDDIVQALLAGGGGTAPAAQASAAATSTTSTTAPAKPEATAAAKPAVPKTYKTGDKGPAGGLVFYDKGNESDGWRYLEAAPASTEWKDLKWAESKGNVDKTSPGIGAGKENTKLIMARFMDTGEGFRAAQRCDTLVYGGCDDWYLPSKLELGLMFVYLKEAGIGGFSEDWYWSSSESDISNGAWAQRFSDGRQEGGGYSTFANKSRGNSVRAIRAF
ncbi:MAG: penicillin-binding protein activator LpoB [Spirochaetaceae bacterium]|jgi:hypothetical protein|nr:penicillin-binding protein activator LpoB [Spirochaetaceae bacterium]